MTAKDKKDEKEKIFSEKNILFGIIIGIVLKIK
jgi:hypothetical protein